MSANQKKSKLVDPQYLACLRSYWNGQIEQCKKSIVKGISSASDPNVDLLLYRLWIEIAAQERDTTTLSMLKAHINQLADESDYKAIYYSLIAIVHFELDEIEAAELMLKSLEGEQRNLYLCELEFWLTARDVERTPEESWLSSFKTVDYTVLEKVSRYFSTNQTFDKSLRVSEMSDKFYPGAYLKEQTQLQIILNLKNWNDSIEVSEFLNKKFPLNPTYQYYAGYSCFNLSRYKDAESFLTSGEGRTSDTDPDILNLLGHTYVELYRENKSDAYYKKAIRTLNKAIEISREIGLPIEYPSNQKMRLEKMRGHDVELTGNFWLAKLNAQSFAQIRTKNESEVRYLRKPLGGSAKPGDLCFFVYEDKHSEKDKKVWRLGALYKVMEKPEWDPIHRFQNLLALQFMPEIAVPLNISTDNQKAGAVHNPDDPRRFDVYQMDQAGFDAIIENVCEVLGEEDSLARTLTQLRIA